MNVYLPNLRLPSAYQEVEYIRTSGTQYINTGIQTNGQDNTEIEGDLRYYNTSTTNQANGKNTKYWLFMGVSSSNKFYGGSGSTWGETTVSNDNKKHNLRISTQEQKLYIDNIGYNISGGVAQYTASGYICIGCVHTPESSSYSYYSSEDIYSFKIKKGWTLLRDFVPCYRKSDGVIGMYDLVNSVFYFNSGTGVFSKGNDVTMAELKNAYIGEYVEETYTPTSGLISIAKSGYKIIKAILEWEYSYTGSSGISESVRLTDSTGSVNASYGYWIVQGANWGNASRLSGLDYGAVMIGNPTGIVKHSFPQSSQTRSKSAGILEFNSTGGNVKVGQTYGNWLYETSRTNDSAEVSSINTIFNSSNAGIYMRNEGSTITINKVTVVYESA